MRYVQRVVSRYSVKGEPRVHFGEGKRRRENEFCDRGKYSLTVHKVHRREI